MSNNIIFKKDKGPDYFAIFLCVFTILIFVFQVMANRHISKAGRDFIDGARAKRIAAFEKQKKIMKEKELEAERALKQQEEVYVPDIETQFKDSGIIKQDKQEPKKTSNTLDYMQKLEIYRQAKEGKNHRS